MKRIFFGLVVATALISHAGDSYLYWMVDESSASEFDYSSAKLVAAAGEKPWDNGHDIVTVSDDQINDASCFDDGFYTALGSYASNTYTFFVELMSGDRAVAYSDGLSYSKASGYLSSLTQFDPGADSLWTATNFQQIPEPTSGMMVLLGMAALALRRRRRA